MADKCFKNAAGNQRSALQEIAVEGLELDGLSSVEFRQGIRGGLHSPAPGRLVFDGDRGQWETRARLLDPLTQSAGGFQYLDYDGECPASRWPNIHDTTGAVTGSGSSRCTRRPHAACALFGCGPASASRYP